MDGLVSNSSFIFVSFFCVFFRRSEYASSGVSGEALFFFFFFLFPQVIAFPFMFSHDTTSPGFSCSYLQFEYTMGDAK